MSDDLLLRAWLSERPFLVRARTPGLTREDREDVVSQVMIELLGHAFESEWHARNALRQRFKSRAIDLRRARAGRSGDALSHRVIVDRMPEPSAASTEAVVIARDTLRRMLGVLSSGERAQLYVGRRDAVRKRGQRARARLRAAAEYERPRRG